MKYFILILLLTSCKLFHSKRVNSSDSTGVKKDTQASAKVDTSKTKSEHTYTKETVYYPGRDTVINNFHTTVPPTIYIRETGTKTEKTDNAKFENWQRNYIDSVRASNKSKDTETKVKVLDFWQILALGMLGLGVVYLIGNKFLTLKK